MSFVLSHPWHDGTVPWMGTHFLGDWRERWVGHLALHLLPIGQDVATLIEHRYDPSIPPYYPVSLGKYPAIIDEREGVALKISVRWG
jgi:hypothetical protein